MENSRFVESDVELSASSRYQRTYIAKYFGRALVERWHTQPMLPWIIAEIKRIGAPKAETIFLSVTETSLKAVSVKYSRLIFDHKIATITKFNQVADAQRCFAYLTKEGSDVSLCHAFQASDVIAVFQLFTVLKEAIQESSLKSQVSCKGKDNVAVDAIQSRQCQHYEVLYVGKTKVSQKRGHHMFVDEAVNKFSCEKENNQAFFEEENCVNETNLGSSVPSVSADAVKEETSHPLLLAQKKDENERTNQDSGKTSNFSLAPPSSLITHSQSLDTAGKEALAQEMNTLAFGSEQFSSIIEDGSLHRQTSLPPINAKTFLECSLGFPLSQDSSSHSLSDDQQQDNRTMLFLIGPSDICLISTDKKELLFRKDFPDISHCSQGVKHSEYFGIICRETTMTGMDTYVGYIFQCQSAKIVDEIMKTLKQSFHCALKNSIEKKVSTKTFNFCETCPMFLFHRLCSDVEGANPERIQSVIMMHIAGLTEREQRDVMSKFQEVAVKNQEDQNIIFIMLLRALFEQKQMKHTHIQIKGRKEHTSKNSLSSLNSLTSMAKKSFPSSFESVFKVEAPLTKTHSLPPGNRSNAKLFGEKKTLQKTISSQSTKGTSNVSSPVAKVDASHSPVKKDTASPEVPKLIETGDSSVSEVTIPERKDSTSNRLYNERSLSDTAAVLWELHQGDHQISTRSKDNFLTTSDVKINEMPRAQLKASPLRNIFMKVGTRKPNFPLKEIKEQHTANQKGSWRKMIFQKVQSPFMKETIFEGFTKVPSDPKIDVPKHSSSQLKSLWKKAIMEQIILIRMEREQKKLQLKQDKILEKHIKLEYDVICPCPSDASQKWDTILSKNVPDVDYDIVEEAVKCGVPRQKRGDVWYFLAAKYCTLRKNVLSSDDALYDDVLKKLTPYQHAILIDLGRTYPGHPYFKQALGSGQLSLFSILKAYSVTDEEVGYCQGLSFLGGILLLHMDEKNAFVIMKHIMSTLGLRNQYKSDMAALQVQMYQLARLIQTIVPEIHDLFDKLDVSPVLYAAPWFLTLFASHFPIGFVARLLDMMLLQGLSVLFKVSVLLLKTQQSQILKCTTFESAVSFLKTTLPSSGHIGMEKVLEQVLTMDIEHLLKTYQIEYMVLKEEMSERNSEIEPKLASQLEIDNKELQRLNAELTDQLQVSQNTVSTLQASVTSYQSTIRKLESRVSSLQDERDALHHSVNILRRRLEALETSTGPLSPKESSAPKEPSVVTSTDPIPSTGNTEVEKVEQE